MNAMGRNRRKPAVPRTEARYASSVDVCSMDLPGPDLASAGRGARSRAPHGKRRAASREAKPNRIS